MKRLVKNKKEMRSFLLKDKKGMEILHGAIIFIILNIVFFASLFIFVGVKSTGSGTYEQIYAKQIALLIDQAKPGTEIDIDISRLYTIADKNKYYPSGTKGLVEIRPEKNEVNVKLTYQGEGYSFKHFNGADIIWEEVSNDISLFGTSLHVLHIEVVANDE
tara:strand:- start:1854 stop:2336 length:483 start_codon:yes stop_codon:yes gene_type:complete